METLLYTLIALVIGSLVTVFVGRFFHKKSINNSELRILLDYESEVLWDIEEEDKNDFELHYKGKRVDNLIELSFFIYNKGTTPITKPIKPLRLQFKNAYDIYHCQIDSIKPEGREIKSKVFNDEDAVEFYFDLLNPNDSFSVRVFLEPSHNFEENENIKFDSNDDINLKNDMEFTITAENLNPFIRIIKYDPSYIKELKKEKSELKTVLIGLGILIAMMAILPVALSLDNDLYSIFSSKFYTSFELMSAFFLLHWLIIFFMIIVEGFTMYKYYKEYIK